MYTYIYTYTCFYVYIEFQAHLSTLNHFCGRIKTMLIKFFFGVS